jgi:hypothetical protein
VRDVAKRRQDNESSDRLGDAQEKQQTATDGEQRAQHSVAIGETGWSVKGKVAHLQDSTGDLRQDGLSARKVAQVTCATVCGGQSPTAALYEASRYCGYNDTADHDAIAASGDARVGNIGSSDV